MKVSELIEYLAKHLEMHGDVELDVDIGNPKIPVPKRVDPEELAKKEMEESRRRALEELKEFAKTAPKVTIPKIHPKKDPNPWDDTPKSPYRDKNPWQIPISDEDMKWPRSKPTFQDVMDEDENKTASQREQEIRELSQKIRFEILKKRKPNE